jgi:sugar phosphate isomerase/epimerase
MELVRKINNPLLGVMFCGFHWYSGDNQSIDVLLADAGDKLFGANICGSKPGGMMYGYTIEPLDSGHMDNFLVMAQLKQHGYKGSVGLQGYGCGGDLYEYLSRSIKAFRAIEKRLTKHPEWGIYNTHTPPHLLTFRGTAPV